MPFWPVFAYFVSGPLWRPVIGVCAKAALGAVHCLLGELVGPFVMAVVAMYVRAL